MAGVVGVEPTSMVLETTVLPMYYTPKNIASQKTSDNDYKLRKTVFTSAISTCPA